MRKLINTLVMMIIFAKTNEKTDKHFSDGNIYKTNEQDTLPVMIFAKQMSQMINTLLMMMEAGRREKGYIAEVLTCN